MPTVDARWYSRSNPLRMQPWLTLEVARKPLELVTGLMHRREMPRDHGMLFMFPRTNAWGLWMHNTPIALDAGWLTEDGTLIHMTTMQPNDITLHMPSRPARYVIELNAGWLAAHDVQLGDRLAWSTYETK